MYFSFPLCDWWCSSVAAWVPVLTEWWFLLLFAMVSSQPPPLPQIGFPSAPNWIFQSTASMYFLLPQHGCCLSWSGFPLHLTPMLGFVRSLPHAHGWGDTYCHSCACIKSVTRSELFGYNSIQIRRSSWCRFTFALKCSQCSILAGPYLFSSYPLFFFYHPVVSPPYQIGFITNWDFRLTQ